jgi:hypothetical protein
LAQFIGMLSSATAKSWTRRTVATLGVLTSGAAARGPARLYTWATSDSTVVSVAAIDSIDAVITGLRPGRAAVTPSYAAGGDRLTSVQVTVVP